MKNGPIFFVKILLASLLMGVMAKLSFNYFTINNILSQNLSLIIAIGFGTYFTTIYFMKIQDIFGNHLLKRLL